MLCASGPCSCGLSLLGGQNEQTAGPGPHDLTPEGAGGWPWEPLPPEGCPGGWGGAALVLEVSGVPSGPMLAH